MTDNTTNEELTTEQELNIAIGLLSAMAATAGLVIALASLTVPVWVPIILLVAKEAPSALKILENVHPIIKQLIVLSHDPSHTAESAAQELVNWIQNEYADVIANGVPTDYNNEVITDV